MSKKGPILGTLFLLPSSIPVYMRLYPYTFEFIDIMREFGITLLITLSEKKKVITRKFVSL